MSATSELPGWFARAIEALQAGDLDGWMEIYAPDAVHEFPFAPDGAIPRLAGRADIAAYMRRLPDLIRFGTLHDVRTWQAGDELIVEATAHHRRVKDGRAVELGLVWLITRRDGKVTRFRDYMNPRQLAEIVA